MRISHHGAHLTYCSNIHPGESWSETFNNLKTHTTKVRKELTNESFGIGLRLSNTASIELLERDNLDQFKSWLENEDLYVFTINGFPYGQFHKERVKDQVHAPDWTTPDRLEYTKRLFSILSVLLPEGLDGGVSTSPISYKWWHKDPNDLELAKAKACDQLAELIVYLIGLKQKTGKTLHLDMEPEPDGILETTSEFVDFFNDYLLHQGIKKINASLGCDDTQAEDYVREHFQLCYDVCHFAVGFEKPEEAINRILQAKIKIGRIQISAALASPNLGNADLDEVSDQLSVFDEPIYLHQAVTKQTNGKLKRFSDLGEAIQSLRYPPDQEIRTHFHVPIFTEEYGVLRSTQSDIVETLKIWSNRNFTNHLEVETYTWDVLPEDMRTDIVSSIARELSWVQRTLNNTN